MKKKTRFVMYCEYREQIGTLTDEQSGQLFKALIEYADEGTTHELHDPLVKLCFSFIRAQMDRDTEKWEDTLRARSEAGKKGGAPKGNRNAAKKQPKQAKQRENENVYENVYENENEDENVNVCENVYEDENVRADENAPAAPSTHTAHTDKQEVLSVEAVLDRARAHGYGWDASEAERFLAYNADKGRTQGWDFAIDRWEERRQEHVHRPPKPQAFPTMGLSPSLDDYASLVNRFADLEEPQETGSTV